MNAIAAASGTWFTQGYDWSSDPSLPMPSILPRQVGVGELGFDFHYDQGATALARQRANFDRQAEVAREAHLPIIVHTREADEATYDALRAADLPATGVIHSYTGDIPFARQLLDLGYYISISGIVTFRNADMLRETAKYIPEDRLLVETDAPYLAPVPLRGQVNRPVNVRVTADFIAALRGVSKEAFAAMTTANAVRCFNLPIEAL
jgi:TatD DNase family protein